VTNEQIFWQTVSEATFKELLEIARFITESAKERFEGVDLDIYDPADFAEMLADYAEVYMEARDGL